MGTVNTPYTVPFELFSLSLYFNHYRDMQRLYTFNVSRSKATHIPDSQKVLASKASKAKVEAKLTFDLLVFGCLYFATFSILCYVKSLIGQSPSFIGYFCVLRTCLESLINKSSQILSARKSN